MHKLDHEEISYLKSCFEPLVFNHQFDLIYEKHVPHSGLLLIEGSAHLLKKNKILETIGPGTLVGLYQMLHNEPVKFGCKINEKSQVILIPKSEIFDALEEDEEHRLHQIVRKVKEI